MGGYIYNGFKMNVSNFETAYASLRNLRPLFEVVKKNRITRKMAYLTACNIDNHFIEQTGDYKSSLFSDNEQIKEASKILDQLPYIMHANSLHAFIDDIKSSFNNYIYGINSDSPISFAWEQLNAMVKSNKTPYRVADGVDFSMSVYLFEDNNRFYASLPVKDIRDTKKIFLSNPIFEEYMYHSDINDLEELGITREEYEERLQFWKRVGGSSLSNGLEYQLTNNDLIFHPDHEDIVKVLPSVEKRATRLSKILVTPPAPPEGMEPNKVISYILDYLYSDEHLKRVNEAKEYLINILPEITLDNVNSYQDVHISHTP